VLTLSDVVLVFFDNLSRTDEADLTELETILLDACHDVSDRLGDPEAERAVAEWLAESLSLFTPYSDWGPVYYLYGYLKGYRHRLSLDGDAPVEDPWLRDWIESHFELSEDET